MNSKKHSSLEVDQVSDKGLKEQKRNAKKKGSDQSPRSESVSCPNFDKSQFFYYRISNYPGIHDLQSKCRIKVTSWNERYLVLYTNYLFAFDSKNVPMGSQHPVDCFILDNFILNRIQLFEERMQLNGLIPRLVSYDNCIEAFYIQKDKEMSILIQFEDAETAELWLAQLRRIVKKLHLYADVDQELLASTIKSLMVDYPMVTNLKELPVIGKENEWIETLSKYLTFQKKMLPTVLPAQYFLHTYTPQTSLYIQWLTLKGNEPDKLCFKRELMMIEDTVLAHWKNVFMEPCDTYEQEITQSDLDNEAIVNSLYKRILYKVNCVGFYRSAFSLLYPNVQEDETTCELNWQQLFAIVQVRQNNMLNQKLFSSQQSALNEANNESLFDNYAEENEDLFSDIQLVDI